MPHFGCTKCHHEWDGTKESTICSWCQGTGKVLEEKTPLEKMLSKEFLHALASKMRGDPRFSNGKSSPNGANQ